MKKTCATCTHFRRYNIKLGWRYDPVGPGYCIYPRSKLRREDTPACPNYQERPKG
jgi:hypothetical protein